MTQLALPSQKKLTFAAVGITAALVLSLSIGERITTTPQPVSARVAPTSFGVQSLQIENGVGQAVINLDDFKLTVLFDYSFINDTNGVLGGEYTDINIDGLRVARITDSNDRLIPDFTDRDDILNIKNMLVSYMTSKGLVGDL